MAFCRGPLPGANGAYEQRPTKPWGPVPKQYASGMLIVIKGLSCWNHAEGIAPAWILGEVEYEKLSKIILGSEP